MASKRQNLFSRLTRLFKAGPIVKRKVRGFDSASVQSSALDVFRKSTATVYGNSLNAYGQYDRLCINNDTLIATPGSEKFVEIQELGKRYPNGEKFIVYAYDHDKKCIVPAWAHHPRVSGFKDTVKITFGDGSSLICTPDHPCLMRSGEYKNAEDLTKNDSMMSFCRKAFKAKESISNNFKIALVEKYKKSEVWDLTVDGYKNFATDTIVVHNSRYADFSEMEYTPEIACVGVNSVVNTPSGDFTISELMEKYKGEDRFDVYCYDHEAKCLTIGKAHHVRKTKTAPVCKVVFDNGESIRCTHDHLFLTRDEKWKKAIDLCPSDSLMPFYRANGKQKAGYNSVYTISNGWQLEHRFVAEKAILKRSFKNYPEEIVHHKDFNKCNNAIDNLLVCSAKEHNKIHGRDWNDHYNHSERLEKIANKISKANKGKIPWNKGMIGVCKTTPEAKKKMSLASKRLHQDSTYREKTVGVLRKWQQSENGRLTMSEHSTNLNKQRWVEDKEYIEKMKIVFSNHLKKLWSDPEWAAWKSKHHSIALKQKYIDDPSLRERIARPGSLNGKFKTHISTIVILQEGLQYDSLQEFSKSFSCRGEFKTPRTTKQFIIRRIKQSGYRSWDDYKQNYEPNNHKVVSVELLGTEDVYDLTTDIHHNFACNGVIIHNSAIDIYADETVAKDEKGHGLHVYSENPKIKRLLEDLFYDTLNFEFASRAWVRNLCKYGDFFLLNDVSPKYGVINAHPIPVNELEREEGFDPENPFAVRFRWVTEGNQVLENWQVTHFRLLGNDSFLPYGSSVLESARRIWRQLIMAEDAMLVYRVIRSPERRVFYIDVANAPPSDVPNIIENARTTLKSQEVVDNNTGRVDLRYNPWAVDIDYFIPVRGTEGGTRVDTLPGGANTTAIDDVEYIQRKLFAALKVPKAYLGFEEALSSKANLAQEDIRFARSIQQIQQVVISELNKIAAIHLAAHGYDGEDLVNFKLQLSNPSTMAQQQKLEIMRTRFEIAGTRPEGMLSDKFIYKEIFGLTDEDIGGMEEDQVKELIRKAQMEQMGAAAAEGGEGGFGGGLGGGGGGGLGGLELPDDDGGGDEGGSEDDGGEDIDDVGDEEDLFASEKPSFKPLITDDEDQVIDLDLDEGEDEYKPVHQQNQATRYRHNNLRPSRRKMKGSNGMKTPNPGDALKHDNPHYHDVGMKRAFSAVKSVAKGGALKLADSLERHLDMIEDSENKRTRLSSDTRRTIDSLSKTIHMKRSTLIDSVSKQSQSLIIEADEGDDE